MYEFYSENSGSCRFHRKWIEDIIDEIILTHFELPGVDYWGDNFRLAKAIHDHSLTTPQAPGAPNSNGGGAAYAFGFDDNSNQSSFLSELTKPTAIKVVITKLK